MRGEEGEEEGKEKDYIFKHCSYGNGMERGWMDGSLVDGMWRCMA